MAQISDENVLRMDSQNQQRMGNIENAQNQMRDVQHKMLETQTAHVVQVARIEKDVSFLVEAAKRREEIDLKRDEKQEAREAAQDHAIDDLQSSRDKQRGVAAAVGFFGAGIGTTVTLLGKKFLGL